MQSSWILTARNNIADLYGLNVPQNDPDRISLINETQLLDVGKKHQNLQGVRRLAPTHSIFWFFMPTASMYSSRLVRLVIGIAGLQALVRSSPGLRTDWTDYFHPWRREHIQRLIWVRATVEPGKATVRPDCRHSGPGTVVPSRVKNIGRLHPGRVRPRTIPGGDDYR